jgi:hypothetical protein
MTTGNLQDRLNQLKAQESAPVATAPATRTRTTTVRRNKYAGPCVKCGNRVEVEAGSISRSTEGPGWLISHDSCPETAQRPVPPRPALRPAPLLKPTTPPIRHGIYTVVTDDGHHATFKISHQADDANFAPGRDILGVMLGSDNTLFTSIGFVNAGYVSLWRKNTGAFWWTAALSQLMADPDAALEARHCARCNRLLTNPDSWELGLGPECAKMDG